MCKHCIVAAEEDSVDRLEALDEDERIEQDRLDREAANAPLGAWPGECSS
jgi:hypothetical protein